MVATGRVPGEWVLLAYRIPREPSTPRIAVWRRLKRLGVAQLLDGLVALPLSARNREQLEWVAEQVGESGGEATVWVGRPATKADDDRIVRSLRSTMVDEYRAVAGGIEDAASLQGTERRRAVARLQREMRRLAQRDHFPPPEAERARHALDRLSTEREAAR